MAKLVVLRGDTVDRKIDLAQLPARIGRAPSNQVVLQDPMKGVSREHAEIRLVDGRYVLVDLGSENGIWVAGRRVPEVVLEPNVIASIGPFRLMLAEEAAVPDTEVVPQMQRPPVPVLPASKPAARQPAVPAPQPAGARSGVPMNQRNLMIGGAVAALVLVVGIVAVLVMRPGPPTPALDVANIDLTPVLSDVSRLIAEGRCQEALQTIELMLQQSPNNDALLNEKRRAETCTQRPPEPEEPTPDLQNEIQNAKLLLANRDCKGALLRVSNVLIYQPDNVEAAELRRQADSCLQAPGPKPTVPPPVVVEVSPELGGLILLPNEREREYRARMDAMRARYEEAIGALEKGPSARAIELLDGILKDTPPGYLDVAARLTDAKRAMAKLRQREAQDFEKKELFDDAIAKLNEAKGFDPALSKLVDNDVSRIQRLKITRGEEACKLARVDIGYAQTRNEAIENFRRVLRWLPPDHQCYALAKQYVR
jgi:tetratricopeptide (TPR) repeat protein